MGSHLNGVDPRNLIGPEPVSTPRVDELGSGSQATEIIGSHLNGVEPRDLTFSETISTPLFVEPNLDAQDIEVIGFQLDRLDSSNLVIPEPISTPFLNDLVVDAQDIEITGSLFNPVDLSNLPVSELVSTPHPDIPAPNTQDIESATANPQDASAVRSSRSNSTISDLGVVEERANATSACGLYCGETRIDGRLCHQTCTSKSQLNEHQKSSTHMLPRQCPFCSDVRLLQPLSLTKHVRNSHTDKLWTKFRCQICGANTKRDLRTLASHIGSHHQDLSLEERWAATRGF